MFPLIKFTITFMLTFYFVFSAMQTDETTKNKYEEKLNRVKKLFKRNRYKLSRFLVNSFF